MKNDPKLLLAKVDVKRVSLTKKQSLGIDFTNEIDVWAKMEFRARKQVKLLKEKGSLDGHEVLQDLNSLIYAIREKLD